MTEILREHVTDSPVIVLPGEAYGDPAPFTPKVLKVEYKMNGKAGEVSFVSTRN